MFQPDQVFAGRYRIVRHIADGGMGALFEAEHVSSQARVALKLLWPHILERSSARRRFELEAKVAACIDSEHIARVLDAGFDERAGLPFLVTELLVGETLAAHVHRSGPLPPARALACMSQAAIGLDAAHGYRAPDGAPRPIVHRGLKPENVFLASRNDGSTSVKILDYGLLELHGATLGASPGVSSPPLYLAYEQVAGEALSPQTDVWAFGLVTYFALTGHSYWPTANEPESTQALFADILTKRPPLPSRRLREDGSGITLPPAFDAWLLRCIERKPARRFASAGTAAEALAHALGGEEAPAPERDGRSLHSVPTAPHELPMTATPGSSSVSVAASEGSPGARRSLGWSIALAGVAALALALAGFGAARRWSSPRIESTPASVSAGSFAVRPEPSLTASREPPASAEPAPLEQALAEGQPTPSNVERIPRVSGRAPEAAPTVAAASPKEGRRARPGRTARVAARATPTRARTDKAKSRAHPASNTPAASSDEKASPPSAAVDADESALR